jgi:hypothetical protein
LVEHLGKHCLAVRDVADLAEPRQIWALLLMREQADRA